MPPLNSWQIMPVPPPTEPSVTPVLTGPSPTTSGPSPRMIVECPTRTPSTSVIALFGPAGRLPTVTPRSRARFSPIAAPLYRRARPATYLRSSSPNHGGSPARAFSRMRRGLLVAGIAQLTLRSERTNLRSACAQVSTPNSRSGPSSLLGGGFLTRRPLLRGTITVTPLLDKRLGRPRAPRLLQATHPGRRLLSA